MTSPSTCHWDEDRCAELIALARNGSTPALEELIGTYRSYLLLVANEELDPQLRGKMAASDVVQEACAEIARQFFGFRGASEEEWRSWIRQMLVHDLLDARRQFLATAKRDLAKEVPFGGGPDRSGADPKMELAASDPSPHSHLIAEEEAALLQTALARLPKDYQEVIRLRNWQLLSFEEAGERLGRSAEAARKLWARAIQQLQREIQPDERP